MESLFFWCSFSVRLLDCFWSNCLFGQNGIVSTDHKLLLFSQSIKKYKNQITEVFIDSFWCLVHGFIFSHEPEDVSVYLETRLALGPFGVHLLNFTLPWNFLLESVTHTSQHIRDLPNLSYDCDLWIQPGLPITSGTLSACRSFSRSERWLNLLSLLS